MRAVLTNGEEVRIRFRHTISPITRTEFCVDLDTLIDRIVVVPIKYPRGSARAITECEIVGGTHDAPIAHASGVSACSWKEQFVKAKGRGIALERACVQLENDEDRRRVKLAYDYRNTKRKS